MDLARLINALREDLKRSAEVAGDDVNAAAERLLLALEPAMRLTLMEALSQAAAEIGARLPNVRIDVRLNGREPDIVIEPTREAAADSADATDDANTSRLTLRLPETLKSRAEALAVKRGQSLNAWLVAAVRAATDERMEFTEGGRSAMPGRRMKGWAR
jgi:HicB-like protein involved in pilus formation